MSVDGLAHRGAVPGKHVDDAVDREFRDALEHMAQVGYGIEAVEAGGYDQRCDRRGANSFAV
jgi:hypothetical protein